MGPAGDLLAGVAAKSYGILHCQETPLFVVPRRLERLGVKEQPKPPFRTFSIAMKLQMYTVVNLWAEVSIE